MGAACCGMANEEIEYRIVRRSGVGANQQVVVSKPINPFRPPWSSDSPMTVAQLHRMREEFWDTAPKYEGRREIWEALRAACEADDVTMAQAIIDSANILLPTGSLSDAYDELGTRYAIPNFCISVPANIEGGAAAAAASLVASADEAVRKSAAPVAVRVRLSTMKDLTIEMLDCDTVLALKTRVEEKEGVSPDAQRVFLIGKLLPDKSRLGDHKALKDGAVVQILVKGD